MPDNTASPVSTAHSATVGSVAIRSAVNKSFRRSLMTDAAATLADLDVTPPVDVAIRVMESTTTEFVLALAPMMAVDQNEIDEDALASVNGGVSPSIMFSFVLPAIVGGGSMIYEATK